MTEPECRNIKTQKKKKDEKKKKFSMCKNKT